MTPATRTIEVLDRHLTGIRKGRYDRTAAGVVQQRCAGHGVRYARAFMGPADRPPRRSFRAALKGIAAADRRDPRFLAHAPSTVGEGKPGEMMKTVKVGLVGRAAMALFAGLAMVAVPSGDAGAGRGLYREFQCRQQVARQHRNPAGPQLLMYVLRALLHR
nr:hypothetical protein GCM10020092_079260 [Actinoplanes digitatis]